MFCYENKLTYPVYISNEKFEICMDLLMITEKINHTMCMLKILTGLRAVRQKTKIKNKHCLQCYSCKIVLIKQKKLV